jgi:hypothetical protein
MRENRNWAVALDPYQSPRQASVKHPPPQAAKSTTTFSLNEIDENGAHVSSSKDGQKNEIEENKPKLN